MSFVAVRSKASHPTHNHKTIFEQMAIMGHSQGLKMAAGPLHLDNPASKDEDLDIKLCANESSQYAIEGGDFMIQEQTVLVSI